MTAPTARTGGDGHDTLRIQRLADPALAHEILFKAMVADPILVNRPMVEISRGAALCRPTEHVLELI